MGRAVHEYIDHTGVDWIDWEDALEAAAESRDRLTGANP
jgi:hypothetical protein